MKKTLAKTISEYNKLQPKQIKEICNFLYTHITKSLKKSESKIWHGSPVWFVEGNPVVAYSVRKNGDVSLMFFSGQSFDEKDLLPEGKFKASEIMYSNVKDIKITHLKRWLKKSVEIQWDYKNIVKNRGVLKKIELATNSPYQKSMSGNTHDQKIAKMLFSSVYPMYVLKVEKKNRTKQELNKVINWLTGFDNKTLQSLIKQKVTFEEFFQKASLNKNADLITGMICGYRIEDIKNPLTKNVRYLDKLVDELAKGRSLDKVLRK